MNANIVKKQNFLKIKYDLKGYSRSQMTSFYLKLYMKANTMNTQIFHKIKSQKIILAKFFLAHSSNNRF